MSDTHKGTPDLDGGPLSGGRPGSPWSHTDHTPAGATSSPTVTASTL